MFAFFSVGNDFGLLKLERTNDSKALIIAAARLDREAISKQLITVKCFKYGTKPRLTKNYNRLVRNASYSQISFFSCLHPRKTERFVRLD